MVKILLRLTGFVAYLLFELNRRCILSASKMVNLVLNFAVRQLSNIQSAYSICK